MTQTPNPQQRERRRGAGERTNRGARMVRASALIAARVCTGAERLAGKP